MIIVTIMYQDETLLTNWGIAQNRATSYLDVLTL